MKTYRSDWERYEVLKKQIERESNSFEEYDKRIRALIERLGI